MHVMLCINYTVQTHFKPMFKLFFAKRRAKILRLFPHWDDRQQGTKQGTFCYNQDTAVYFCSPTLLSLSLHNSPCYSNNGC